MTRAQWNFIKSWLIGIACVSGFAFIVAGIALQAEWILMILAGVCCLFILYAIAIWIASSVYRWRVMAITEDDETELFDYYWRWIIKDGRTSCKIEAIKADDDWKDLEYKAFVLAYLQKVEKVPIPKILTI
jgi:hypothetical protein